MREYYFSNIKNHSLGNASSRFLDGAISTSVEIPFITTYVDAYGPEGIPDYSYISSFVSDDFEQDSDNMIFVNENGAVANAYRIVGLSEEEMQKAIAYMIKQEQEEHPDYNYKMVEGQFPVNIEGGRTYSNGSYTREKPVMSTHVLYITDYKEHLKSKVGPKITK